MSVKGNTSNDLATLAAFAPVLGQAPKILILGSMPGVASLNAQQYYAHPRNAFWPIMRSLFNSTANTYANQLQLIKRNHIALWDVLAQCQRPGSLDSNIQSNSIVCNDFATLLTTEATIRRIVFNGKTAEKLFLKHVLPSLTDDLGIELLVMPSTSPAMASLKLEQKIDAWRSAF